MLPSPFELPPVDRLPKLRHRTARGVLQGEKLRAKLLLSQAAKPHAEALQLTGHAENFLEDRIVDLIRDAVLLLCGDKGLDLALGIQSPEDTLRELDIEIPLPPLHDMIYIPGEEKVYPGALKLCQEENLIGDTAREYPKASLPREIPGRILPVRPEEPAFFNDLLLLLIRETAGDHLLHRAVRPALKNDAALRRDAVRHELGELTDDALRLHPGHQPEALIHIAELVERILAPPVLLRETLIQPAELRPLLPQHADIASQHKKAAAHKDQADHQIEFKMLRLRAAPAEKPAEQTPKQCGYGRSRAIFPPKGNEDAAKIIPDI